MGRIYRGALPAFNTNSKIAVELFDEVGNSHGAQTRAVVIVGNDYFVGSEGTS